MLEMKSYIKLLAIYILRVIMRLFYLFPIKKGRVVFNSYRGNQYSCNPKYISEYLERNYKNIEIIWFFRKPEEYFFLKKRGIKVVRYASLKRFYYEATAEYSINNVGSFSWLPLRKNQHHINTWHGGGCYKRASLGEKVNDRIYLKTLLMTVKETSEYISSSQFFSDKIIPEEFGFKGNVLNIGMPRNDIFFEKDREKIRNSILDILGINSSSFIVLYAPTWRYDMYQSIDLPDFKMIKNSIKERYQKECVMLYRAHPNLRNKITGDFVDVTEYKDMQELLLVSDMLISDYSSCIWDYSILKRPCFLFVPDLKKYEEERGFVVDIHKWGFPIAYDNFELKNIMKNISNESIIERMSNHQKQLGTFEKGKACKEICEIISGNKGI